MSKLNYTPIELEHKETEHVPRQSAAERLTAIADALSAGGRFEFTMNGEQISIPIGDGVRLKRELKLTDGQVELELELRWSTAHATAPLPPSVAPGS
jgi:amphi-Trp domain-containing protein